MVEGKMMKVGTELRRIRAFSPINFPIKLSTDKRVRLPLRSSNVFRKGSRFDLNLKEKRKEGNILYFDSLEIYSSIKILSKVEEEIYIYSLAVAFEYSSSSVSRKVFERWGKRKRGIQ